MEGPKDDFPTEGGGGQQPADSPIDSLNGIEFAQAGPQPAPDRQRPQEKSKSQRERLKYRLEDQFEGRLPGVEPNERLERLTMAVRVVTSALEELRKDPAVSAKLAEHGITLKDTAYYMPIIIKESALKPDAEGGGYFQIYVDKKTGRSQTLSEVEKYFGRKFSSTEINYSGKDAKKLDEAAKKNAMAGILYWHLCRDVYWKKKGLTISDKDRDRVAATCYNLGPTAFLDLWDTIRPRHFTQFARMIGKDLAQKFPENIAIPEDQRPDAYHDGTYDIGYWVHAYETQVLTDTQVIKIGKYEYRAKKLLTTLRYAELVNAMMGNDAPVTTKELPEPLKDFEVVGEEGQWMWSIAEQLLTKCADEYTIPYCTDSKTTKTQKIQFLIGVLITYNRINNPAFEEIDEVGKISRGTKVFFPSKEYIEKAIEQSDRDVPPPETTPPPEVITREGLYTGANAAEWSRRGLESFPKISKPTIITPDGVAPETKSDYGRMPKSSVTSIVIHTTEGASDGLYESLGIHYIVKEDGTIHLIRNHDIAIDHAGLMGHRRAAYWNGDRKPSLHSVGIEIENKSMETLIGEGKFLIEADPAKVASKGKGTSKVYYTDKPPSQAALDRGIRQARSARAINTKQYEALKSLVHWLGYELGLKKKDVVTHSMVATSRYGRGRKDDPPIVDWAKLGLPENHHLIDQDVLAGRVKGNLSTIKDYRDGTKLKMVTVGGKEYYKIVAVVVDGATKYSYVPLPHFGEEEDSTAGIEAAIALRPKKK